jgi:hypothetical protein
MSCVQVGVVVLGELSVRVQPLEQRPPARQQRAELALLGEQDVADACGRCRLAEPGQRVLDQLIWQVRYGT